MSLPQPVQDLLALTSDGNVFSLIPYNWGMFDLPDYVTFIKNNPEIFCIASNSEQPSLLRVSCRTDRYVAQSRLSKTFDSVVLVSDTLYKGDPYETALESLEIASRQRLVPSLRQAEQALTRLMKRSPHGVSRLDCEKVIQQATGGQPIPLKWFEPEILFIPGNRVFLRKVPKLIAEGTRCAIDQKTSEHVLSLIAHPIDIEFLAGEAGLDVDQVIKVANNTASVLFSPYSIYSAMWPSDYLKDYTRRESEEKSKTAFRELVEAVIETVQRRKRMETGVLEYWCASLGVAPKWVYQSAKDKVVSSAVWSDMQVLLRKKPKAMPASVPWQVTERIVRKVKEGHSQIDALTRELKWTKTSEDRSKYGGLYEVLGKIGEIFYEPEWIYDRGYLSTIVDVPDRDEEENGDKYERMYRARLEVSAKLKAKLNEQGKVQYSEYKKWCAEFDIGEEVCWNDLEVFFPLKNVFLLKAGDSQRRGKTIEAVLAVFQKAKNKAVDLDVLNKCLEDCGLDEIEVSSDFDQGFFFHDPLHIYPVKTAVEKLQGGPFDCADVKPILVLMEEEQELAQFVKKLTDDIHVKFDHMIEEVLTRIDAVSQRIEDLEKSVSSTNN